MGTSWRVRLAGTPGLDVAALRAATQARLDGIVAEMSHWQADSRLGRFNRAHKGAWLDLPPDFATVISAALDIAAGSGGAFDPALGALVDLWGYGPVSVAVPPSDHAVQAARAVSGWRLLDYYRQARRLRQPGGLRLDLSGIAKGFAVDAIADLLAQRGVRHCLAEIGGELVGRGLRPDGDPWWVELENPPGVPLPPIRIALHELAVATSGDYVRGAHTIDPATGRPLANGVRSVSVLHASAMLADAWASALTVLGPDEGMAMARRAGLAVRLVTDREERLSPALAAML